MGRRTEGCGACTGDRTQVWAVWGWLGCASFPLYEAYLHIDAGNQPIYMYGAFLHDGGMGASSFTCSAHPPVLRGDGRWGTGPGGRGGVQGLVSGGVAWCDNAMQPRHALHAPNIPGTPVAAN